MLLLLNELNFWMNKKSPSEKTQEQAYGIEEIATPRRHKLLNNKLANKNIRFFYFGGFGIILDFLK